MPALQLQVEITTPALGADSSLLGAAELAFEPMLNDPAAAAAGWDAQRPVPA